MSDKLHPRIQEIADVLSKDYLDPEYPRDLLVAEVTELRAKVGQLREWILKLAAGLPGECNEDILSSRVCEKGTICCVTEHLTVADDEDDDDPGTMVCKEHHVEGCRECWVEEQS